MDTDRGGAARAPRARSLGSEDSLVGVHVAKASFGVLRRPRQGQSIAMSPRNYMNVQVSDSLRGFWPDGRDDVAGSEFAGELGCVLHHPASDGGADCRMFQMPL